MKPPGNECGQCIAPTGTAVVCRDPCGHVSAHAGELDRTALGLLVFGDPAARRRLNAATHTPVAVALLQQLACFWMRHTPCVVRGCRRNSGIPCFHHAAATHYDFVLSWQHRCRTLSTCVAMLMLYQQASSGWLQCGVPDLGLSTSHSCVTNTNCPWASLCVTGVGHGAAD